MILPGPGLSASGAHLAAVRAALPDAVFAVDDGHDLAFAIEAGDPLDEERLRRFLTQFEGAREVLVGEGILVAPLTRALPGIPVRGVGEALLPLARAALGPKDFLVIESRAFHASFSRVVAIYSAVRDATGAAMNLDLHRIAIPTGATSLQSRLGAITSVPAAEQIRWLLEGRDIARIVCESQDDLNLLEAQTDLPVVHIAALAGQAAARRVA